MFLIKIKGGLSNYHQTKGWNEGAVEMMLVQTLKSHRNLKRSSFSIFIQKLASIENFAKFLLLFGQIKLYNYRFTVKKINCQNFVLTLS